MKSNAAENRMGDDVIDHEASNGGPVEGNAVKENGFNRSGANVSGAWVSVCKEGDLTPDTGVCALVGGEQVAIFKVLASAAVYAVSNYDPIGEANVLSRGIVGSLGDEVVVASPLYKQHFNLQTGVCVEQPEQRLKTYPVRVADGEIQVQVIS